jgi:hypothetical protein
MAPQIVLAYSVGFSDVIHDVIVMSLDARMFCSTWLHFFSTKAPHCSTMRSFMMQFWCHFSFQLYFLVLYSFSCLMYKRRAFLHPTKIRISFTVKKRIPPSSTFSDIDTLCVSLKVQTKYLDLLWNHFTLFLTVHILSSVHLTYSFRGLEVSSQAIYRCPQIPLLDYLHNHIF